MPNNQIRIIGGTWRSRKLYFPDLPELRPTPNRIRETLFNWLSPHIAGAHCLDLFAGSGALGFEALSRGASSVLMIDQSSIAVQQLQENARLLSVSDRVQICCGAVPNVQFPAIGRKFDIVFLDPPFLQNYLSICCQWLEDSHCLASNALIYIEAESSLESLPIPEHWRILRSKKAGQVGYCLCRLDCSGRSPG